jgi:hypothetical protein
MKAASLMVMFAALLAAAARLHAQDAPPDVKPGEIAGRIVDEHGAPIEGALVDAWTWYKGNETKTDKDGRFVLKKLDKRDNVELRISKDGFCPWYNPQQETGVATLNVTLNSRTYFEGTVRSPDDKPVPNALVRADNGPHQGPGVHISTLWTEVRSGPDGRYRLYVSPAAYDLQVRVAGLGAWRSGGRITINEGDTPTVDIPLEKGVTFVAKAVDSQTGEPVHRVKLSNWQHKDIEGMSDEEGFVTIDGMQPGEFEFQVKADGYARWWSDAATKDHQRIPDGKRNFDDLTFNLSTGMEPVTITLEKGVTITGQVVDPDGKPVAGATVDPARTGTGNSLSGDTRFSVTSKNDGSFKLTMPASLDARHNLFAHDGKYGKWRKWANAVGEPFQAKPGDKIENVTLTLQKGGTVKGRATYANGEPAADRRVRAAMTDGLDNRYYMPESRTDKDGNFELKFVRPGEAMIQVEPYWLDPNQAPGGTSQTVTVKAGETTEGIALTAQERN